MVVKTCPACRGTGYVRPLIMDHRSLIRQIDGTAVLADLNAGMSQSKVCKKWGISKGTVYKIANRTWAGFRKDVS